MLARSGLKTDQRNTLLLCKGMQLPTAASCHPLQMILIKRGVGTGQVTPSVVKTSSLLAKGEIAVKYDAVNTVITTVKQFQMEFRKNIARGHILPHCQVSEFLQGIELNDSIYFSENC